MLIEQIRYDRYREARQATARDVADFELLAEWLIAESEGFRTWRGEDELPERRDGRGPFQPQPGPATNLDAPIDAARLVQPVESPVRKAWTREHWQEADIGGERYPPVRLYERETWKPLPRLEPTRDYRLPPRLEIRKVPRPMGLARRREARFVLGPAAAGESWDDMVARLDEERRRHCLEWVRCDRCKPNPRPGERGWDVGNSPRARIAWLLNSEGASILAPARFSTCLKVQALTVEAFDRYLRQLPNLPTRDLDEALPLAFERPVTWHAESWRKVSGRTEGRPLRCVVCGGSTRVERQPQAIKLGNHYSAESHSGPTWEPGRIVYSDHRRTIVRAKVDETPPLECERHQAYLRSLLRPDDDKRMLSDRELAEHGYADFTPAQLVRQRRREAVVAFLEGVDTGTIAAEQGVRRGTIDDLPIIHRLQVFRRNWQARGFDVLVRLGGTRVDIASLTKPRLTPQRVGQVANGGPPATAAEEQWVSAAITARFPPWTGARAVAFLLRWCGFRLEGVDRVVGPMTAERIADALIVYDESFSDGRPIGV